MNDTYTVKVDARVHSGHTISLPGPLDAAGNRTVVEPYVKVPVRRVGFDDDGHGLWMIPTDAFPPGARISTPALPAGDRLVTSLPRPNQEIR